MDEALQVINRSPAAALDEYDKFKDTAAEIYRNPLIRDLVATQIAVAMAGYGSEIKKKDFPLLLEIAMTNFANGVKIGMEMEKCEPS